MGATIVSEVAGRTLLTTQCFVIQDASQLPVEMAARYELAAKTNPYFMYLHGRFVEADRPNLNGAFWTSADLEMSEFTVKHSPLNYLHRARHVIGTLTDSALVKPPTEIAGAQAAPDLRTHIAATAAMWKNLYPHESKIIEMASSMEKLWFSMECRAEKVRCETSTDGTRVGCGREFDFELAYASPESTCEHVRNRTSQRHMVNPYFIGGAIIVPPAKPGWQHADVSILKEAAKLAEQTFAEAASARYSATEWEALMGMVVQTGRAL